MLNSFSYFCFCSHIQSLVELESVIVATASYFEHTAPLTYSLCTSSAARIFSLVYLCQFLRFLLLSVLNQPVDKG